MAMSSLAFGTGIGFLENSDFRADGGLNMRALQIHKPVVVMFFSTTCGHCTKFKPTYQKFAEKAGYIFPAAVQIDDHRPGVQALYKRIQQGSIIPNFRGVPTILFYNAQGNLVEEYKGNRNLQSLMEWSKKLTSGGSHGGNVNLSSHGGNVNLSSHGGKVNLSSHGGKVNLSSHAVHERNVRPSGINHPSSRVHPSVRQQMYDGRQDALRNRNYPNEDYPTRTSMMRTMGSGGPSSRATGVRGDGAYHMSGSSYSPYGTFAESYGA